MTDYEILLMLDPELAEERQTEIVARMRELVEKGGGTFERHDAWGRRKLAYEIDHKADGHLPPAALHRRRRRRSTRSRACSRSTTASCATWRHVASRAGPRRARSGRPPRDRATMTARPRTPAEEE